MLWHILLPVLLIAIVAFARRRWVRIAAAAYLAVYPVAWTYLTLRDGLDQTRAWAAGIVILWALTCIAVRRRLDTHDGGAAADEQDDGITLLGSASHCERARNDGLPCAQCGYDLRGFNGATVRCPECGHLNERRDLELSAEELATRLRVSVWSRAVMPAVLLLTVVFVTVFIRDISPERWRTVFAPASAILFLVWLGSLAYSYWSSGSQPNWARVVLYAHLSVVLTPLGACVLFLAIGAITLDARDWIGWALAGGSATATLVGAWGYRRLRYNLAIHDRGKRRPATGNQV